MAGTSLFAEEFMPSPYQDLPSTICHVPPAMVQALGACRKAGNCNLANGYVVSEPMRRPNARTPALNLTRHGGSLFCTCAPAVPILGPHARSSNAGEHGYSAVVGP